MTRGVVKGVFRSVVKGVFRGVGVSKRRSSPPCSISRLATSIL